MARDRNSDRANLGEQADMSRTEIERQDRMGASSREDSMAGSEGVEDQALERSNRESLESDQPMRGSERVDADRKSSRGGSRIKRSQSGSGRSRQQGRESTDNSGRSFSGQGNQKEGASEREGTGYMPSEDVDESGGLGGNR